MSFDIDTVDNRRKTINVLVRTLQDLEPISLESLIAAAIECAPTLELLIFEECHHLLNDGALDLWVDRSVTLNEERDLTGPYGSTADAIRQHFLFDATAINEADLISAIQVSDGIHEYYLYHAIARLVHLNELGCDEMGNLEPRQLRLPQFLHSNAG